MTTQTKTCTCIDGWKPCEITATRHCFVCGAEVCEACTRPVLTKTGWVRVCACTRLCLTALELQERLR